MLKQFGIYLVVIVVWRVVLENNFMDLREPTGVWWLLAVVVWPIFIIGAGIIDAINGKK